ncbi:unnamed protein product [Adineta ricciae]|nr:unnamed protein product [Adineta ricciae]
MKNLLILLFFCSSFCFITSQIPNPQRYQITIKENDGFDERELSIDRILKKGSSKLYKLKNNQRKLVHQEIYHPDHNRTYKFDFEGFTPKCTTSEDSPFDSIDYWSQIVKSHGGENQKYGEIVVDDDCNGECLIWSKEYISQLLGINVYKRLFVRKANMRPIKKDRILYDAKTHETKFEFSDVFVNWNLGEISESEYEFPMDVKTCSDE